MAACFCGLLFYFPAGYIILQEMIALIICSILNY